MFKSKNNKQVHTLLMLRQPVKLASGQTGPQSVKPALHAAYESTSSWPWIKSARVSWPGHFGPIHKKVSGLVLVAILYRKVVEIGRQFICVIFALFSP